jgi:hypothetical protein
MVKKSQLTPNQLRDEFVRIDDEAYLSRTMLVSVLNRTNGWLHLQERKGKVPPYIQVGHSRLYRKKDVLAYFFKIHTAEVI